MRMRILTFHPNYLPKQDLKQSRSKTTKMMMTTVAALLLIHDALYAPELCHVAWDGNQTLLLETVLLLGFFEQLHEQRMIEINQRHHEPLLLLALPHHDRQKTLGRYVLHLLLQMQVIKCRMERSSGPRSRSILQLQEVLSQQQQVRR